MTIRWRPLIRRLQVWTPAVFWFTLLIYAVWPWLPGKQHQPQTVIFYGFSTLGDALNNTILPAFQRDWRSRTGEPLEFATSFAGSGTVTNQLIMGVPAQLALLSLESDAGRLVTAGLIQPGSWKRLPHQGIVNRTPFIILVRPGNPKGIRSFADLARPGVKVVHPDPLTSGAANWAILAEYGAGMRQNPEHPEKGGYELLLGIWRNVVAQAQSARSARTQFDNGFGDALVTYEQEALWDKAQGDLDAEIVYPPSTIMSEHVLVIIERNIPPGDQKTINALIDFLWSDQAQRLFIKTGFRSVEERLNSESGVFVQIADPFLVGDLGGWDKAGREIVEGVWKNKVLKELGKQP